MLLKKYRFGFDVWALVLFFIIMIPNFIWFAVPAPNDILRGESITKTVDEIASICQVLMVMSLCIFIHQDRKKISITRFIMTTVICCLLYFLCWVWLFFHAWHFCFSLLTERIWSLLYLPQFLWYAIWFMEWLITLFKKLLLIIAAIMMAVCIVISFGKK